MGSGKGDGWFVGCRVLHFLNNIDWNLRPDYKRNLCANFSNNLLDFLI